MRQYSTCYNNKLQKHYSNRRGHFRNISNCLKNFFIKITQQINFLRFKRALWCGPYCTFRPKMPNRCTKNGTFAKHLKKNYFLGPKNSKIYNSKNINIILKIKYVSFFIVYRTRKKIFSAIKRFGYKDMESPICNI